MIETVSCGSSTASSSTTALFADGLSVCSSEHDAHRHHIGVTGTNLAQFCIGDIEPQLHKTFAASRCPSDDFVYIPPEEMFSQLDDFCDESSIHYASLPLVICGQPGVGKSALLSNWRNRRINIRRKYLDKGDVTTGHSKPFIFWHVAGCSRVSCHVPHMLRRLMTELKSHFDLTREVSKDEDRLRWDLPTFLEMAARKGPVILIIDGVHRMRDEEGEEDLKWLPLEYPGNVRVIVSTTVYKEDGGNMSIKKNKSLTELKRRGWDMMEVKEMSSKTRKEVFSSFLKLTSQLANAPTSTLAAVDESVSSLNEGSLQSQRRLNSEPLLVFPSQIKLILNSPATSNPAFLRTLLSALHWSANRGFDLWRVVADWVQAESVSELHDRILNTWETGMLVSAHAVEAAENNVLREGGYETLLKKHPWLGGMSKAASTGLLPQFVGREQEREDEDVTRLLNTPNANEELPLAETQYRKVHADAEQAIVEAKASAEKAMSDLMAQAQGLGSTTKGTGGGALPRFPNEQVVNYFVRQGAGAGHRDSKSTASGGSGSSGGRRSSGSGGKARGGRDEEEYGEDFEDEAGREFITLNLDNLSELDDVSLPQPSSSTDQQLGSTSGPSSTFGSTLTSGGKRGSGRGSVGDGDNFAAALMGMQITMGVPSTEEGRKEQLERVPSYLRGGRHVEGFGATLGNALAVLYVARHGLTTLELTKLLNKLRERSDKRLCSTMWRQRGLIRELLEDVDKEGSGYVALSDLHALIANLDNRLRSGKLDNLVNVSGSMDEAGLVNYDVLIEYCGTVFRNERGEKKVQKEESDTLKALSLDTTSTNPDHGMEEALLEVLVSLGVMYSKPNQVMVLTLESETLRDVVQHRYVRGTEGVQRWHNAIMKYFQTQPSTMRRCEELPWHLHICRRWNSLKDTLSDLWAFELMYLGKLKLEFFEYWRILTEGPLYLTESSEKAHGLVEQNSTILSELDTATVLGLSEACGQKEKLRGQMATFDMIECYNKAVEHWRADVRPSTSRLASMLNLIAQFLAEFSEVVKFQHQQPKFLRKPLNFDSMQQIGVDEVGFLPKREKNAGNAGGSVNNDMRVAAAMLAEDTGSYYYFKRWMWMQFPWISLANTKLAMQLFATNYQVVPESSKSSALELPCQLGPSTSPSSPTRNPDSVSALSKFRVVDPTATFKRMWMVKKLDPQQEKASSAFSRYAFHSMLNSCTDHLAPSAEMSDRLIQSAYADKAAVAFRMANRKFDAKPRDQSMPFSQSTIRSQKHGTRIPTVEQIYRQTLQEKMDKMDVVTASSIGRFGGLKNPTSVEELMEREVDTAIISGTASLGSISAHSYAMPITAKEKTYIDARTRVAGLRTVLDKLRAERGRLWGRYQELQLVAVERDNQDALTVEKLKAGEYVIDALQARLLRIQAAVQEGEALGGFYRLVIEQCRVNPAKDVMRLECLDQQLVLASTQLHDLVRQRHRVYLDKEHIEKDEVVKANLQLEHFTRERKKTQQRIATLARRSNVEAQPEAKRSNANADAAANQHRSSSVSNRAAEYRPFGLLNNGDGRRRMSKVEVDKALVGAQLRAEKVRAGMEKLFELAGTDASEGVMLKMNNTEKLHEGLMEQCKHYELKVAELKAELQRMEKKLQEVNVDTSDEAGKGAGDASGNPAPGEQSAEAKELHNMDDSIFLEEMRAIKNRRAMLNAHQFLDQVKTGVNHLARLAAKYSIYLPVMALRAPDGLHEEKYDDSEMPKILGLFEERITAMKESLALEAGDTKMSDTIKGGSLLEEVPMGHGKRRGEGAMPRRVSSVCGIDTDTVLSLKKEKHIISRFVDVISGFQAKNNKVMKDGNSKYKVCINATAVMDAMFDASASELQRKEDEQQSRAEAEAENKAIEVKGGTENFIRQALSSKESQIALRRMAIRELDKGSRQFLHDNEGLGIAIEDALLETNVHIGKLWGGGATGPATDDPVASSCKKGGRGGGASSSRVGTAGSVTEKGGGASSTSRPPTEKNQVLNRESLKAISNNIVAKRKRLEMKALLATKVAQEAGDDSEGGGGNVNVKDRE